jgi:transcriptional regulator with XRE-family HTH domain
MPDSTGLAAFLRARRELLKPADVGLAAGGRRRVAGLRREEVAMLAGISTEYYLQLEQGRGRQPSDRVLGRLAQAMRLGDDAIEYMRNLARSGPRSRNRLAAERLDPGVQTFIDTWVLTPAYVQDRSMTVVAANAMARALVPYFTPPTNLLRAVFLDPEAPAHLRNWDAVTLVLVSWLRYLVAEDSGDPELNSHIVAVNVASQRFRTLWARQEVKQKTCGPVLFDHPEVGPLELRYRTMLIPESRHTLVVYYAEPGSTSAERLQLLSTLALPSQD